MAIKKTELYSSLWAGCDELRGGMDASQYKDYVLTLLFMKYVSDKYKGDPYPISQKPSHQLSWSHYVELLKIDDDLERGFYEKQAITERWSVPELKRQKASSLFLRLAASKDKAGILALAHQGQIVEQPTDLLREPYIFEFLKIPEYHQVSETQLETLLCNHLQPFLLELGKGFTFVGRQYRITLNNSHYKVDLVFYHRILRCFVLIDLKLGEVHHHDIGQMNMYLGYFANEENIEGDKPIVKAAWTALSLSPSYKTYPVNWCDGIIPIRRRG